jgi:hypothetical protein
VVQLTPCPVWRLPRKTRRCVVIAPARRHRRAGVTARVHESPCCRRLSSRFVSAARIALTSHSAVVRYCVFFLCFACPCDSSVPILRMAYFARIQHRDCAKARHAQEHRLSVCAQAAAVMLFLPTLSQLTRSNRPFIATSNLLFELFRVHASS